MEALPWVAVTPNPLACLEATLGTVPLGTLPEAAAIAAFGLEALWRFVLDRVDAAGGPLTVGVQLPEQPSPVATLGSSSSTVEWSSRAANSTSSERVQCGAVPRYLGTCIRTAVPVQPYYRTTTVYMHGCSSYAHDWQAGLLSHCRRPCSSTGMSYRYYCTSLVYSCIYRISRSVHVRYCCWQGYGQKMAIRIEM